MPSIEVKPSPHGVPGAVTDPTRISAEELTFGGDEGTPINGYLARPADAASHPGMIVIHEAGGLGEHIRDVTNRLAGSARTPLFSRHVTISPVCGAGNDGPNTRGSRIWTHETSALTLASVAVPRGA
ncbi:MAG TPA: dienelactone hydrolase family protein [Solirubrobacteraceae bacterium]|jgi:hypothetical protein